MLLRTVAAAVVVTIGSCGVALADRCDSILTDGVFSNTSFQNSEYAKLVMLARLTTMESSEASDSFGHEGSVGIGPIKIGPGTWNSDRIDSYKKTLERSVDIDSVIANQTSVLLSSGDPEILQAWTTCIAAGGLTFYAKPQGADAVVIEIEWTPFPTNPTEDPVVVEFTHSAGTEVIGGSHHVTPRALLGIRLARRIVLSRAPGAPVMVSLSTSVGDATAYFPGTLRFEMPEIKLNVSGWVGYQTDSGVSRMPVDFETPDFNFQVAAPGPVRGFQLTVTQLNDDALWAQCVSAPGALNCPDGATMDSVPIPSPVFRVGSQVPNEPSGTVIQVFVDPKEW